MSEEKKTSGLSYNELRILAVLSWGAKTRVEVSEALKLTGGPVCKWLRRLQDKGLVFISGMKPQHATQPAPIYSVHVWHEMPERSSQKAATGKHGERLQSILDAFSECGPMTPEELTEWIGCHRSLIDSAITYYRKGGKCSDLIRIKSWVYVDKARCGWTPQYAPGPGPDAKKPTVDKRQYMAAWRERNRAKIRAAEAARRLKASGKVSAATNPFWQLMGAVGVVDHSCKRKETEAA
jgi:hypothetical protein